MTPGLSVGLFLHSVSILRESLSKCGHAGMYSTLHSARGQRRLNMFTLLWQIDSYFKKILYEHAVKI